MTGKKPVKVAVSLDVEEEGLFGGIYRRDRVPLENVASLVKLESLFEFGVRPTLFCVHEVFKNRQARGVLESLRKKHDLEIGCHLHFWNTPPHEQGAPLIYGKVPAGELPNELLDRKLASLFAAARSFTGKENFPFRMGRWDLHPWQVSLLVRHNVICDASFRPFHAPRKAGSEPDHFDSPADPFWIGSGSGKLFEVPLTVVPLFKKLPALCKRLGGSFRASLKNWGALSLLPVYHPLWLMKYVARKHIENGGRVLSLTWHSSEMMAGGAPHMPDERHVKGLLARISDWIVWLKDSYQVEFATMTELRSMLGKDAPVLRLAE